MSQEYHHGIGELKASTQNEQVGGSTPNVPTHVASQGKNTAGTTTLGTQQVVQHTVPAIRPPVTVFVVVIVSKSKDKTML
jgi:hypothetical protein